MKIRIRKYIPLVFILVAFILAKLSQLTLPHYWDEAWSYATAVHKMYDTGITLLPGVVDVEATRGHPLFFYFAASSWMKIFGTSLVAKHSFALLISVLLLIAVYEICYKLFNIRVAGLATILLASQVFFFVQSSMLLPEVMVALFFFISIYFFVSSRYILLSISLSLLLLTKESGFVLGLVFGVVYLITLFNRNIPKQEKVKMFVALLIPAIIIGSFFILQKSIYGWYFFPEHIGLMDNNFTDFASKFQTSLDIIFTKGNRIYLWIIICAIAIYCFVKSKQYKDLLWVVVVEITFVVIHLPYDIIKKPVVIILYLIFLLFFVWYYFKNNTNSILQNKFFIVAIFFSVAYLIFCSVNFFTVRYLLPVLILSIIALVVWLDNLIKKINYKYYLPFALSFMALCLQHFFNNNNIGDIGLGSYNAIKVQQDVIQFLDDEKAQNKQIGIEPFQQKINMQNPACGFVKDENAAFSHVRWEIDSLTDYAVFDNIEPDKRYEIIKNDTNYKLVYEINRGYVWAAVFKRKKNE